MQAVILTIHLLLALALIMVVLLQRSEGGGLGMGGGGSLMTSRGAATALSKVTWAIGAAFVATSLALTILAARDAGGGSVIDQLGGTVPMSNAPAPGLEGDLLPPTTPASPAAPATPPAATAPGAPETPPATAPAPPVTSPPTEGPSTPPPVE
jgi:preprotein translocase subunit SecG